MTPAERQTKQIEGFNATLDSIVEAVLKKEDIRPLVDLARRQIGELGLFVEEEPPRGWFRKWIFRGRK